MTPTPGAQDRQFDFIIVGSGAGGGPLAARLARTRATAEGSKGFKVLLLEAGSDHIAEGGEPQEVSLVPGFHGLSTEHKELSWRFWVKHYGTLPEGVDKDPKCHPKATDPPPPPAREGIFYPRAAGLGGCTVHNAMITIAGPDSDWEDLADFVADDSWRAATMRPFFQRLERNEYLPRPTGVPTRWGARVRDLLKWLFGFTPDHTGGRHGFDGWLHTSVTDYRLGLRDKQLVRMLKAALLQARASRLDRWWKLARTFLKGQGQASLDPNHSRTQAESPEGIVMVPLAVCGTGTTIHQNSQTPFVMKGRRSSPRELLLETAQTHPDNLTIWTDVLVNRVLFEGGPDRPRAIGVEFTKGKKLYSAHVDASGAKGENGSVFVRPGGEVVLCAGAFNTPQLLMLSGIGDSAHLAEIAGGKPDACVLTGRDGTPLSGKNRIHLPGVGRNLQDRYEVTLISKMKKDFSILDGATFTLPGSGAADRHLKEWRADGTGLYTSNGSVLGILKRSNPDLEQPDLFIFGLPFPFLGYDLDYSKLKREDDDYRKFTWAILKGRTRNADGRVRLRSTDPRDTPDINFHYFNEGTCPGRSADDPDLVALVDGVRFVRGIERRVNGWFWKPYDKEIHPGHDLVPPDDETRLKAWIRRDAWGHHACGTCRMGPAGDPNAVLDSRFRVNEVDGLRVVDASIFPRIPGYFIVTNIYMASEKAADVIAEDMRFGGYDSSTYPRELRKREVEAVFARRKANDPKVELPAPEEVTQWAPDVAGIALSGGGIRSATFNLGALQALARVHWLRRFDFLSTVSGGGYIGSFLGRWFDRLRPQSEWGGTDRQPEQSVADHVEKELNDASSPAVSWLRRHGNYIAPQGAGDKPVNSAVFVRGFFSVHFVVGMLLLTIFGVVNGIRYGLLETASGALEFLNITPAELPIGGLLTAVLGIFYSPWFIVFEAVILFLVVPRIVAYWIAAQRQHEHYEKVSVAALLVICGSLLFAAVYRGLSVPLLLSGLAPLLAFVHVEMAWRRGHAREDAIGRGSVETQRLRTRNSLTSDLGLALSLAGGAFIFALIDAVGYGLQQYAAGNERYTMAFASFVAALGALAPFSRWVANLFAGEKKGASALPVPSREQIVAGVLAVVLFAVPMVFVAFVSHVVFAGGAELWRGLAVTLVTLVLSWIFAHKDALTFVNRSSLAQVYSSRLTRAYLGATNPVRFRPQAANVTEVVAGDDVPAVRDYKPHMVGGPLHLINVTVNQTVDFRSQRGNRDRKGENMVVSSIGMSIGKAWHSRWGHLADAEGEGTKRPRPLELIGHQAGRPHPLIDETGAPTRSAEMLSLGQWIGISGAAVGPGRGQTTRLGTSLLYGIANLRTGHWWDSGLPQFAREGLPPRTFLRRWLYVLGFVFHTQTLLLYEWTARFAGPWDRFWHLSDGGFFEVLGAYELIRRRVPRIIVCDGSVDPEYDMGSFANLVRKARIDFHAEIVPFTEADYAGAGIPPHVRAELGGLDDLKPSLDADGRMLEPAKRHAALFWVDYGGGRRRSVLLYLRANLTGDEGVDIDQYRKAHPNFPNEPTSDQFFDEEQWESYRRLGEHMLSKLTHDAWFWNIPLQ